MVSVLLSIVVRLPLDLVHSAPPFAGVGLSHVLVVCTPQAVEQSTLHAPQPPSTGIGATTVTSKLAQAFTWLFPRIQAVYIPPVLGAGKESVPEQPFNPVHIKTSGMPGKTLYMLVQKLTVVQFGPKTLKPLLLQLLSEDLLQEALITIVSPEA